MPSRLVRGREDEKGVGGGGHASHDVSSNPIVLPEHDEHVPVTAFDIGGTLAKCAYFSLHELSSSSERDPLVKADSEGGGRLNFVKCDSHEVDRVCEIISQSLASVNAGAGGEREGKVALTGGGAYKLGKIVEERLGVEVVRIDEMSAAVKGATFLMTEIPESIFCVENMEKHPVDVDFDTDPARPSMGEDRKDIYPYLLVNVGSGVSLVKVVGDGTYERVSGTSLGGATFWGLGRLLTSASSFEELLGMAERGDSRNVDMLVGDIYGGNYSKIGLASDTIASSLGKAVRGDKGAFKEEDIAMSLLRMISYNIGQLAYNIAELHGLKRIFFGGYFIRNCAMTMDTLAYAVNFWSKGSKRAHFFRHDGYLGALGTLMTVMESSGQRIFSGKNSWIENFGGARQIDEAFFGPEVVKIEGGGEGEEDGDDSDEQERSQVKSPTREKARSVTVPEIVFDMEREKLLPFPKIADVHLYHVQRLTLDLRDARLRTKCLSILKQSRPKLLEKAVNSQGGTEDAQVRANECSDLMSQHAQRLIADPFAYGELSFPFILELREQCLRECGFDHVYHDDKVKETETAFSLLPSVIRKLREEGDEEKRIRGYLCSVLAGNVYDWGSISTMQLYEAGGGSIDFSEIRHGIEEKEQWVYDGSRQFARKLRKSPYKKAVFFFDNSGSDCILGMIPLVDCILEHSPGASVVLVANPTPVINDVTRGELAHAVRRAAKVKLEGSGDLALPHLALAMQEKRLSVYGNGQKGPCLDLKRIPEKLANECNSADLLVLEGLARAIHSNFHVKFSIDTLKLALVKSEIVAEYFGCSTMDGICKFEEATPAATGSSSD